jgi:UDP-glucose 4-epimerase
MGGRETVSMKGLAEMVIEETGSKSPVVYKDYAEVYGKGFEDIQERFPSIDRIVELINWVPVRTVRRIVADTVEYWRKMRIQWNIGERSMGKEEGRLKK